MSHFIVEWFGDDKPCHCPDPDGRLGGARYRTILSRKCQGYLGQGGKGDDTTSAMNSAIDLVVACWDKFVSLHNLFIKLNLSLKAQPIILHMHGCRRRGQ